MFFRKSHNTLFKLKIEDSSRLVQQIHLDSVNHVHVCKLEALNNCVNYFPNVTDLTFDDNFDAPRHSLGPTFNRILPLLQVTKLAIQSYDFKFEKLIELLCFTPNIHTL